MSAPRDYSPIPEIWDAFDQIVRHDRRQRRRKRLILVLLATVIVVASLLAFIVAAFGHEAPTGWQYDASCCSGLDCQQAPKGDVKETPEGYRLSTGELIPYRDRRIKRSKDEFFHECKPGGDMSSQHSFCLYVPDRGF